MPLRRERIPFFVVAAASLVLLAVLLWPRKSIFSMQLPDGSKVKFTSVTRGKALRMYVGEFWQKPLFTMFRTNLPVWLSGTEKVWPSRQAEGAVGLIATRSAAKGAKSQIGHLGLGVVEETGEERPCELKGTHSRAKTAGSRLRGVSEQMLWELPSGLRKVIRLRLCYFDLAAKRVTVKEFVMANPSLAAND